MGCFIRRISYHRYSTEYSPPRRTRILYSTFPKGKVQCSQRRSCCWMLILMIPADNLKGHPSATPFMCTTMGLLDPAAASLQHTHGYSTAIKSSPAPHSTLLHELKGPISSLGLLIHHGVVPIFQGAGIQMYIKPQAMAGNVQISRHFCFPQTSGNSFTWPTFSGGYSYFLNIYPVAATSPGSSERECK